MQIDQSNTDMTDHSLQERTINTIRFLAADAVQHAQSGHPGMPMGMASAAYVLWTQAMSYCPSRPDWWNRDRFVLSAGHGSMLLYAMLYLTGYDLSLDDLKRFRRLGSRTPGHPEVGMTPGVETTTGPLGQGFANAVGMGLAARWLAQRYNRPGHAILDHHIFSIVSDGDLMEGVASEAASLAGHLRLGRLIFLFDDNRISIDGPTENTFTEDVPGRFRAYGWHVQSVDGMDVKAVANAITAAKADERPSLICCRTTIGYGSPNKGNTAAAHSDPLGAEEVRLAKERLGWPVDSNFHVPEDVLLHYREAVARGEQAEQRWQEQWAAYAQLFPAEAAELRRRMAGELPDGWETHLPEFGPEQSELATRMASGATLNALAPVLPELLGGSADLSGSNRTFIEGHDWLHPHDFSGRNIHFGVREHGMAAICNGMALYGGVRPYCGTFLVFSDYMRPGIRLAALMRLPVIFIFSHDSFMYGEDGATHQPVEQTASLRAIPRLQVIRPADANEAVQAWRTALLTRDRPTALILSRQPLPIFDRSGKSDIKPAAGAARGGYILAEAPGGAPDIALVATGSEVALAFAARQLLWDKGIAARVVSMPCIEIFQAQDLAYRETVLPPDLRAVCAEAGIPQTWTGWLERGDLALGVDDFGASGPGAELYASRGMTAENLAHLAAALRRSPSSGSNP